MMGVGHSQGQLDASVLDRIFVGELDAHSVVEETDHGAQITLGEHPHYGQHLRLARITAGLARLRDPNLLQGKKSHAEFDLTEAAFSEILFELFQNHETGFLLVSHEGRTRTVALSAGLPIASSSNLKSEQLGQFLLQRGVLSQNKAEQIVGICEREARSLGWGLLSQELISVEKLLDLMQMHARLKILPAFSWTKGKAAFYRDHRASSLSPVINLSFMDMVRAGVWRNLPDDLPSVEKVTSNLLQVQAALKADPTSGAIVWELTELERQLLDDAQGKATVAEILKKHRSPEQKSQALRSLFTMCQMGLVQFDASYKPMLQIPLNPLAYQHRSRSATHAAAAEMEEYKLRKKLEDEGRHLFFSHDYKGAAEKFQRLADRQDQATDALAYLAVCTLLINPGRHSKRGLELAHQAVSIAEGNALAHAALSRVHSEMGKDNLAKRHEQRALVLSEHNPEWLAEVHVLLNTAERIKQVEAREPMELMPLMIGAGVVLVGLFFLSNVVGLGDQEYFYRSDDPFFWGRRLALGLVGIAGLSLYFRENPLAAIVNMGFRTPVQYILVGLIWGIFIGFQSPPQRVEGLLVEVFALTLFHVLVEEIFFRAFLTRLFMEHSRNETAAVFVSALVFGLYHITYQSFWVDTEFWMKWYWMGAIMLFAGLPYAWLYARSKSILPPLVAHLMVNLTMMWVSFASG